MRLSARYFSFLSKLVLIVLATSMISACGLWDKEELDTENLTAEELYGIAKESMQNNNWLEAIKGLQQLEARYPYGEFAIQAQLDTAYVHYKANNNGSAIAAADRFISINPTHPSVDYAYYLKGLASFDEESSLLGTLTGRSDLADRDQKSIVTAISAFTQILNQYPNSQYAFDADKRITHLESALAEHEVSVARFYFSRGAYVAALNRSKAAIEVYGDRPQVEDALGLMLLSYQRMGMQQLADDTKRVLATNYPNSGYLNAREVKKKESTWRRAFSALID